MASKNNTKAKTPPAEKAPKTPAEKPAAEKNEDGLTEAQVKHATADYTPTAEEADQVEQLLTLFGEGHTVGIGDGTFTVLDAEGNTVDEGSFEDLIAQFEDAEREGETDPATAKQLEKSADAKNAKEPKSKDDNTIRSFADLEAALSKKGIEVGNNERTYNLTLVKKVGKDTKQYSCRVHENATDAELAQVYQKAVKELG